ncbi:spore coat protein [Bacillus sp. NTK071]|uniref:spore coat protein n=1 Tax=Bacillus sp. NTK071 TaxID=2802175 RepID=UPI001A8C7D56|nr:spore coat protein [Bacillus sp. NTK071]MBN8209600.1 spore coat protein [Bacillus sp. NTK071]
MQANFSHMKDYIGHNVQINRGGPEKQIGELLDLQNDFLTVKGENDVVFYYQTTHLKSVTVNTKEELEVTVTPIPEKKVVTFAKADNFNDLLKNFQYSWVQINRGGPEKVEGALLSIAEDHVILAKDAELMHISMFHIKSVSNPVNNNQEEDSNENTDSNDKQNGNESKNDENKEKNNQKNSNKRTSSSNNSLFSNNWKPVQRRKSSSSKKGC